MSKSELKRLCTQYPIEMARQLEEYKQRTEAAEAKLRELEMQEPVAYADLYQEEQPDGSILTEIIIKFSTSNSRFAKVPLYAKPSPAPKQEEK